MQLVGDEEQIQIHARSSFRMNILFIFEVKNFCAIK